MALPANSWPAAWIICASVSPDLSSPVPRVSDTVRTAMRTGMKGRDSSILGICTVLSLWTVPLSQDNRLASRGLTAV